MTRERLADLLAGLGIHNRAVLSPDPATIRSLSRLSRSPDVILMRLGRDAPLGRQIERSVTIVITPILSGLHHCYARI
jgi:hypothetical protein